MKKICCLLLSLGLVGILSVSPAGAATFDTNSAVLADEGNFWPWGDYETLRYQLWLSQGMLGGFTGTLDTLTHFVESLNNVGSQYTLEIYASTTPVANTALSASNLNANHGPDVTPVFSGTLTMPLAMTLTIDVDNVYTYSGGGNLLLDYVFTDYSAPTLDFGPDFESVPSNNDFWRVTSNAFEGNAVYDWGAIRTEINAVPVPEPASLLLLGSGLLGIVGLGRKNRK